MGASPNGWLYNGSPAPQTISTGISNSITLTPNSSASSNISATVTAGGTSYNTNTTTVSTSVPSLSQITGPSDFCTSGTYSVPNLPLGATINWSVSSSSIASFSSTTGSQVTVNKVNAGMFDLTATLAGCGNSVIKNSIKAGVPLYGNLFAGVNQNLTLKSSAEGANFIYENSDVYWGLQGTSASQYSIMGGYLPSWTSSDYFPNVTFYMNPSGYVNFAVSATENGCSETLQYTFVAIPDPYAYSYYSVAPNPVVSDLTIYVDDEKLKNQKIEKSPDQVIQQVIILDKFGNVIRKQTYPADTKKITINVSGLSEDMYAARIYNGKKWTSIKFMKKN